MSISVFIRTEMNIFTKNLAYLLDGLSQTLYFTFTTRWSCRQTGCEVLPQKDRNENLNMKKAVIKNKPNKKRKIQETI